MNAQIRPGVVQQGQHGIALHQVVVLAAGDGDVGRASLPQLRHHEGAEKAGPAGDGDAFVTLEGGVVGPGWVHVLCLPRMGGFFATNFTNFHEGFFFATNFTNFHEVF